MRHRLLTRAAPIRAATQSEPRPSGRECDTAFLIAARGAGVDAAGCAARIRLHGDWLGVGLAVHGEAHGVLARLQGGRAAASTAAATSAAPATPAASGGSRVFGAAPAGVQASGAGGAAAPRPKPPPRRRVPRRRRGRSDAFRQRPKAAARAVARWPARSSLRYPPGAPACRWRRRRAPLRRHPAVPASAAARQRSSASSRPPRRRADSPSAVPHAAAACRSCRPAGWRRSRRV